MNASAFTREDGKLKTQQNPITRRVESIFLSSEESMKTDVFLYVKVKHLSLFSDATPNPFPCPLKILSHTKSCFLKKVSNALSDILVERFDIQLNDHHQQ